MIDLDQPLGKITGSLGVALFPDNGKDYSHVLKAADEALYHVKNEGRDRVCFSQIKNNEIPNEGMMPCLLSEPVDGPAMDLRA